MGAMSVDMSVELGGLKLSNPVLLASGTCGYGLELTPFLDLRRVGGVVVKGISLEPRDGNPPPRLAETPCGLLNSIGLENVGAERFLSSRLPQLLATGATVIVNILGSSAEEYAAIAARLRDAEGISALEVNISCPNVKAGGVAFGQDPRAAAQVVEAVRKEWGRTLIVKLSPNVTDVTEIARAVEAAGADAVSLINTLLGMAIDVEQRRPVLANTFGGLSGPAIRPVAVRMVWQTVRAVKIPVIGIGGIASARDALEFLLAGASAVQVGTATLADPGAAARIVEGIEEYMARHSITSVSGLAIGQVPGRRAGARFVWRLQ